VSGKPVSVTLPTNVAPGDYLVRHEIIALQLAVTLGGAEFYPSCTQIRISGSQTGTPNQTVSFPGAYNDNDPGIYDPNVYSPGSDYVFPGPPVSNLASPADTTGQMGFSGSASPSGSGGASTATTNGANPTSTNYANPTSTSGSGQPSSSQPPSNKVCKLRKRNSASLSQRDTAIVHHKRHTRFTRDIGDAFYSF
jgi:Auxiliary Activity family 9 (formerly GH61)